MPSSEPMQLRPKGSLTRKDMPSDQLRNDLKASRFRASFDTTAKGLVTLSLTVENDDLYYRYRQADDEGAIREQPITAMIGELADNMVAELRSRGYKFPDDIPAVTKSLQPRGSEQ